MDNGQELVDISTAAIRLGVTPEAVRKRIARGTLSATKQDGRWYVVLEGHDGKGVNMETAGESGDVLTRSISRRNAIKAGGIVALGLAFSKPIISSLHPPPAYAQALSAGPGPGPPYWSLALEAEDGTIASPMIVGTDSNASGGRYISVTSGDNSTTPAPEATYNFSVPEIGTYYLWALLYGPDFQSDALYVGIDGSWDRVFTTITETYEWVRVENSGTFGFVLSQGAHTIQVGHGEINARLDTLYLTSDADATPTP